MSTDLRSALHRAVADSPEHDLDPAALVAEGSRRVRRRTMLVVGASVLVVAAIAGFAAAISQPSPPDVAPAEVLHLDLDRATELRPVVAARTRTAWRDEDRSSLEYDRFEGITTDGLVLRGRYTNERGVPQLGLLDPLTGDTEWLPTPPSRDVGSISPLELSADRLVLFTGHAHELLVLDRTTLGWQRSHIELPRGIEVHVPPRAALATDGRAYVSSTMEGGVTRYWWSVPVPEGGPTRKEPTLAGHGVAWRAELQVRADAAGRVVATGPHGEQVLAERRPSGCERPDEQPGWAPDVLVAGGRAVVTYPCESGTETADMTTVVHDTAGREPVEIEGARVLAASDDHVMLAAGAAHAADPQDVGSTYLLDLERLTLSRVGRGPHEAQVALVGGIMLWNSPGPTDSDDEYDVVWKVAPVG